MNITEFEKKILEIILKENISLNMKKIRLAKEISSKMFKEISSRKLKMGNYSSKETMKVWKALKKLESKNLINFKEVFYKSERRYRLGYELKLTETGNNFINN